MNLRTSLLLFLGLLLSISSLVYSGTRSLAHLPTPPVAIASETYLVKKVIDGDTFELASGQRVRLIGINTPETVDPRRPVQCFGAEASAIAHQLLDGKSVRLQKDVSQTDKYGRLLRYVWVGDIFVNEYLVSQGYAQASSYPPDIKYQAHFQAAQRLAESQHLGLWSACEKK